MNTHKDKGVKKEMTDQIKILVNIEKYYDDCYDKEFGTFDYELFGEKILRYLEKKKFKKFI